MAVKVTVILTGSQADGLLKALGTSKPSKTVDALVAKVTEAKAAAGV